MIDECLAIFESSFSRKATFKNFCTVLTGLLNRSDHLGVTSVIRSLDLPDNKYECLIHFFRSTAYSLPNLEKKWAEVVASHVEFLKFNDAVLLIGDGLKRSIEGSRIPGTQRMHQESENSGKGETIHGHMFGSVMAASADGPFAIPLSMHLHEGIKETSHWEGSLYSADEHHVQLIRNAYDHSVNLNQKSIIVLDRLFMNKPTYKELNRLNKSDHRLEIVTRAKRGCVAFMKPEIPEKRGRGRPKKRGDAVKVFDLFETRKDEFKTITVEVYGKEEEYSYLCMDLLWGPGLYQEMRFVLTKNSRGKAVFTSTDMNLSPEEIIQIYSHRFKIERAFKEYKHVLGGFSYRFWTNAVPELNRFKKSDDPDPLSTITDKHEQKRILDTIGAIERFCFFGCVAMGITQIMAMNKSIAEEAANYRYLRTRTKKHTTEATIRHYLSDRLFSGLSTCPGAGITQIIQDQWSKPGNKRRKKVA